MEKQEEAATCRLVTGWKKNWLTLLKCKLISVAIEEVRSPYHYADNFTLYCFYIAKHCLFHCFSFWKHGKWHLRWGNSHFISLLLTNYFPDLDAHRYFRSYCNSTTYHNCYSLVVWTEVNYTTKVSFPHLSRWNKTLWRLQLSTFLSITVFPEFKEGFVHKIYAMW